MSVRFPQIPICASALPRGTSCYSPCHASPLTRFARQLLSATVRPAARQVPLHPRPRVSYYPPCARHPPIPIRASALPRGISCYAPCHASPLTRFARQLYPTFVSPSVRRQLLFALPRVRYCLTQSTTIPSSARQVPPHPRPHVSYYPPCARQVPPSPSTPPFHTSGFPALA